MLITLGHYKVKYVGHFGIYIEPKLNLKLETNYFYISLVFKLRNPEHNPFESFVVANFQEQPSNCLKVIYLVTFFVFLYP